MTITKTPCSLIDASCADALRSSFTYAFTDDAARDTFFSANPHLLKNANGLKTVVFTGNTSLTYEVWAGTNEPIVYDHTLWNEIPVSSVTVTGDIHYWGDPHTDKTMRARRDAATGFLYFERRVNGAWIPTMTVSNSISLDSVKFIESLTTPVVEADELGLYSVKFKDSEHNDEYIVRGVYTDAAGNHYVTLAARPDGSLRVPNNVIAALADLENVPLTYNHVLIAEDGAAVVTAIGTDASNPLLPAKNVEGLEGVITASTKSTADIVKIFEAIATINSRIGAALKDVHVATIDPHTDKTATIHFTDGSSKGFDASVWFGTTPPPSHDIWFGFTTTNTPDAAEVKSGVRNTINVLNGHDVDFTRPDGTVSEYMYVWIPTGLGRMAFANVSGFHDVWAETPLTVDTVDGHTYLSDNKTFATTYKIKIGAANVY